MAIDVDMVVDEEQTVEIDNEFRVLELDEESPDFPDQEAISDLPGSDEDSEESDGCDGPSGLPDNLKDARVFVKDSKLTCTQINNFLAFWRSKHPEDQYPKSYKTLLKSPRVSIKPIPLDNGHFFYFGIRKGLMTYGKEVLKG